MTFLPMQNSPGPGGLDPKIMEYIRQQQWRSWLNDVGQGLMKSSAEGYGLGPGLVRALGQAGTGGGGGSGGLLKMLELQRSMNALRAQQDKRQRADRRASEYSKYVGGLDPRTGINWRTGRVQPQVPARTQFASSGGASGAPDPSTLPRESRTALAQSGFTPRQQEMLRAVGPEAGMGILTERMFPSPVEYGAPMTVVGPDGKPVLVRLPKKGLGDPVPVEGYTPYEKSGERGGLTQAQTANNSEINNARQSLTELQRSLPAGTTLADELRRRMSQYDPLTGLETPDFNSHWGRIGWLAMQSKVGGDPDIGRWTQRLMPVGQPPAETIAEEPQPAPASGGGGFFENLWNRGESSAAPLPGPAGGDRAPVRSRLPGPRGRFGLAPSGTAGPAIERMSFEQLDDLVSTQGDTLTPADLRRIEAQLSALERTPQRRLPR